MPGPDVFDQLHSAKWRNVEFPVTRMRVSIAHDLAEHKYWGVDGARVESTGLAPWRFSFSAPLINGITPGRNESWAALYPNQMRALLAAFQQKAVGDLQHPEFGNVSCKAERFDMDWDASRRGGVEAELTFVQTLTEADLELKDTPVQGVDIGDLDLNKDSVKVDLKKQLAARGLPLPPYLADKAIDLDSMCRKIGAIGDYPNLLSYRVGGQIGSFTYQIKTIQRAVDSARSALTWPVTQEIERMKASTHALKENVLAAAKTIKHFKVPAATTLAGIARQLPGAKIGDVIKLNPGLMRNPEIPAGTDVRYYAA